MDKVCSFFCTGPDIEDDKRRELEEQGELGELRELKEFGELGELPA